MSLDLAIRRSRVNVGKAVTVEGWYRKSNRSFLLCPPGFELRLLTSLLPPSTRWSAVPVPSQPEWPFPMTVWSHRSSSQTLHRHFPHSDQCERSDPQGPDVALGWSRSLETGDWEEIRHTQHLLGDVRGGRGGGTAGEPSIGKGLTFEPADGGGRDWIERTFAMWRHLGQVDGGPSAKSVLGGLTVTQTWTSLGPWSGPAWVQWPQHQQRWTQLGSQGAAGFLALRSPRSGRSVFTADAPLGASQTSPGRRCTTSPRSARTSRIPSMCQQGALDPVCPSAWKLR